MEAKGRTARMLVRRLIGASSEGDAAAVDAAISEIRLLSKHDPDFRLLLTDAGAVPLLAHHLLVFSDDPHHANSTSSQEDAAAALLNLSLSNREPLMATPGLLDALAATLGRPASPAAFQHAAAAVYSLLSVEDYRPIIGANNEILSALVAMLRPPAPPRRAPTRSVKDALKALFAVALYPLNRAALVGLGAVPALFTLVVKDGRTGIVEDCTAVLAQVAGCEESPEAFRRVSGAQILVDLVDASTGASQRTRENAAAALLNLALGGGEKAVEDIREVETALPVVRELAEAGTTPRAKSKAGSLLDVLVDRQYQQEQLASRTATATATDPCEGSSSAGRRHGVLALPM